MHKRIVLIYLTAILMLVGCSVSSGPKQFDNELTSETNTALPEKATEIIPLKEAIDHTQSDLVKQFWFRAHIANNIEKRRNTHMTVNGIVKRPHGYYMRNTLVTQPYEYYRWNDQTFIRQNNNWFRGREPELPFDIFYGFHKWEPLLGRSEVIRADDVLGIPTIVHQIELNGIELLDLDDSFAHYLPTDEQTQLTNVLDNTNVQALFYVGDITQSTDDREVLPIIYKSQIFIQMPVPDAGYMEQEVQHFIFRVNLDNIEMTSIDEIERYVIEIDDAQTMMEQEELEEFEENQIE